MKRKKKNEDAGYIYNQTGISQQALIQYTGANQSTLSRHLSGTRLLSGEPALKLVHLLTKLAKLPKQPIVQTLSAEEQAELKRAANWCRTLCTPLQKKLEIMQADAAKADCLLQFVAALEKEETTITDATKRWYASQRYAAQTKLEKNSRYEQIKIEAKMAALQKEAELYEASIIET